MASETGCTCISLSVPSLHCAVVAVLEPGRTAAAGRLLSHGGGRAAGRAAGSAHNSTATKNNQHGASTWPCILRTPTSTHHRLQQQWKGKKKQDKKEKQTIETVSQHSHLFCSFLLLVAVWLQPGGGEGEREGPHIADVGLWCPPTSRATTPPPPQTAASVCSPTRRGESANNGATAAHSHPAHPKDDACSCN